MTYLPLRVRAKFLIKRIFPKKIFLSILSLWRKTGAKLIRYPDVLGMYEKQFVDNYGVKVAGGPFKGMLYVDKSVGSSYLMKLVGAYEEILHPVVENMQTKHYATIVDIGCAEGYYLIGLGRSHPDATLIGYDLDNSALALTKKLYENNHLANRLVLEKDCTHEALNSKIGRDTLVICDAEGFEGFILDPDKCPALKDVQTLLIELHDELYPGIKKALNDRFSPTHAISTIPFKHADAEKYPFLRDMKNKKDRYNILYERIFQDQEWLIMEKK